MLVEHGANVNHVDEDGKTRVSPLYLALKDFLLPSEFVRTLLKYGAKFNFDHTMIRETLEAPGGLEYSHLLLRHTALFEAQNRHDGPANFDLNLLNEELRKYYARCRDELELMKSIKIEETNVSFFKILVNPDIGPYTRNESIRNVFDASNVSKRFPIYGDLLCERFSKEVRFQKLVEEATNSPCRILNCDRNSSHILLSNIISHLDESDLNNLALI